MPVDERTRQPFGLLHGGASRDARRNAGQRGRNTAWTITRFYGVGQEINANHLRSARSGRVTGTARPVHVGRRSQVWDIRIEDDQGRLTCVSRLTMSVLDGAAPGPRPAGQAMTTAAAPGALAAGRRPAIVAADRVAD